VKGVDGVLYERASEEHGRLKVEPDSGLRVGDKIELIVSHCCTNVTLYDHYHCVRNGSLEALWRISARGRSQ
jgi:3-hydroxy-D-aspartate aldolase